MNVTKLGYLIDPNSILSISQNFEKQLKDEKDAFERRIRELQVRLDESRRDHEVEITSLKTDLRLAREDSNRLQQDLEDAEEKLKEGKVAYYSGRLLLLYFTKTLIFKAQKHILSSVLFCDLTITLISTFLYDCCFLK